MSVEVLRIHIVSVSEAQRVPGSITDVLRVALGLHQFLQWIAGLEIVENGGID